MASQTEIANRALDKLGEASIINIDDNVKAARTLRRMFNIVRDAELRARKWSFSIKRALLAPDVNTPIFGFAKQYQLPVDCLRVLAINEQDIGPDLTDYRNSPNQEYVIESRRILFGGNNTFLIPINPLPLRFIASIADTTLWDASFVESFACRLASESAEALTQSSDKRKLAWQEYQISLGDAKRANAIELPPDYIADDTWIMSRLRN